MSDNHEFRGAAATVAGQVLLVLGAIAVTFVAGLGFCWLRLRSRSLIAPVLAHAAIDGLALTVAWFTVHHLLAAGERPGRRAASAGDHLTSEMMLLRWVNSSEVKPAGRSTAFQPSTYSAL